MVVNIEEIGRKKPHLKDPLRLYEKALVFTAAVQELPVFKEPMPADLKAYPHEAVGPVVRSFVSIFELPEGSLSPLQQAMELGEIDFTRLPLGEVPSFSLPYAEEELATLLFLLSKPYFLWMRDSCRLDGRFWDEGKCPVCNAHLSLSSIAKESKRQVYCSFCGTLGYYRHIGCPICLNNDAARMNIISVEEEKGFRIDTCDACGSYVKTVEADLLSGMSPETADLVSLPLDIIAQEKGYVRHSPNPIGMTRMI